MIEIQACGSSNRSYNRRIRWSDWISSMDTDEGRPLARSEDKYRRVWRKLIHHHAYRARPYLTETPQQKRKAVITVRMFWDIIHQQASTFYLGSWIQVAHLNHLERDLGESSLRDINHCCNFCDQSPGQIKSPARTCIKNRIAEPIWWSVSDLRSYMQSPEPVSSLVSYN
jgi:hypothetical protein